MSLWSFGKETKEIVVLITSDGEAELLDKSLKSLLAHDLNIVEIFILLSEGVESQEIEIITKDIQKPVIVAKRQNFCGHAAIQENHKDCFVLFFQEGINLQYLDMRCLIGDCAELGPGIALMPTVYGGSCNLHGPEELALADIRRSSSIKGKNLPALFPAKTVGPFWVAEIATVLHSTLEGRCLSLPQPGIAKLLLDLRQPICWFESGNGADYATIDGTVIQEAISLSISWVSEAPGAKSQAFIVLDEEWNTTTEDHGYQYQILSLARKLADEKTQVTFITSEITNSFCYLAGFPAISWERFSNSTHKFKPRGYIIATSRLCLETAWALHYLSLYKVYLFEQLENSEQFYGHQLDKLECAHIRQQLGREHVVCYGQDFLRFPVSEAFYGNAKGEITRNAITVICQQAVLLSAEMSKLLAQALATVKTRKPDLEINLVELYAAKQENTALTQQVTRRYRNINAESLNRLYSSSVLVIDADSIKAPTHATMEALASGCVVMAFSSSQDSQPFIQISRTASEFAGSISAILEDQQLQAQHQKLGLDYIEAQLEKAKDQNVVNFLDRISEEEKKPKFKQLSVVIPVTGEFETLALSLRVLELSQDKIGEIIVVDNNSPRPIISWLKNTYPKVNIISLPEQQNIASACLSGLLGTNIQNNVILMLPHTVVTPIALESLMTAYNQTGADFICPVATDNKIGFNLNANDDFLRAAKNYHEVSVASYPQDFTPDGGLVFISREVIGHCCSRLTDYSTWDYALKGLAIDLSLLGRVPRVADNALVITLASMSDGVISARDMDLYERRWGSFLKVLTPLCAKAKVIKANIEGYKQLEPKYEITKAYLEIKEIDNDFGLTSKRVSRSNSANALLDEVQVVFLLPSVVLGGGSLSVLQHVDELNLRGIKARVFTTAPLEVEGRPYLSPAVAISANELLGLRWTNQIVIATFWTTAYLLRAICKHAPKVHPYYYIQDYEPWFYSHPDEFSIVQKVEKTYEFGFKGVAKTQYLADIVRQRHGVDVRVITPGIDPFVFYPGNQDHYQGRPRLAAMYRPETPRRGGAELVEMLGVLKRRLPQLEVNVFGQNVDIPSELEGYMNVLGKLKPAQVAELYRNSDIVVDLSFWHGFGRMGIEGMSAGAVPVLSKSGGVDRYAKDGENAFLVDLDYPNDAAERVITLAKNRDLRLKMRENGQAIVKNFTESKAAEDWIEILGF